MGTEGGEGRHVGDRHPSTGGDHWCRQVPIQERSGEADDKDVEILYGASPVRQPYKPGRGTGQQGEARVSHRQGDLAR